MQTHRYAEGTRVRVQRGRFPMDPGLVGRTGLIVDIDTSRRGRYGVQLDREEEVRDFSEDELVPLADEPKPEADRGSAGPGLR